MIMNNLFPAFNVSNLGTLPSTVNTTINATTCVSSVNRGCCSPHYDIQIRNCGKFNVYKLASTKACPQGYCFGELYLLS